MTYEKIVELLKEKLNGKKIENHDKTLSAEVNIRGEGEGAFYIEAKEGEIHVEPFEYYNHDVKITISSEELLKLISGEKELEESIAENAAVVEGDKGIALNLMKFEKEAPLKTRKKPTAKKAVKAEKKIVEAAKKENSKITKEIKKKR